MTLFLVWIGITAAFLILYTAVLWSRHHRRGRFQAKLTVFFLLFVFIPTVPLTFFAANLLTRSAEVLLLPGIGTALETSLETIRIQAERCGEHFIEKYPERGQWENGLLRREGIQYIGLYEIVGDDEIPLRIVQPQASPLSPDWTPPTAMLRYAHRNARASDLTSADDEARMVYARRQDETSVVVMAYAVSPRIIQAKDEITRALGIYNTLGLLKESIIQKNLIWALAVLFIVGLTILSIVVARNLSRGISEPVKDLVGGMQRVADDDLDFQVETSARDEFRFLVDSFNRMVQDLRTGREKLIRAERMAAWQQVARQISHEIKNSLTPIALSLRRLHKHLRQESLTDSVTQSLRTVEEELNDLQTMAAEFSEFARMPEPQKAPLDLNNTVQSTVRLMETSAGRVEIKMQLASDLPELRADREQIKRLLINLIKNSLEASHDTGTVTVATRRARSEDHAIEIEILDEGEGMDEETLDRIFQPYYTTKKKGTGLGLAIVQKITEDHEGIIRVESEKEKYCRVTVLL